ncbi:MAG TPA: hypothetical protein VGD58_15785 [Herpetosiphonaceae bacterium]
MRRSALTWLVPLICLLALIAAGAGLLWPAEGISYPLTSFRGEHVLINGRGLYRYDTVSTAAQMQANDLVTLVLGLPLLAIAFGLATHGSLRGRLVLTGTLGFFLYTYTSMTFGTAYNQLFLLYVALWSLSLFACILSVQAIDVAALPQHFSPRLPRRSIAALLVAAGGFLLVAWLGRIVPPLLRGETPALENTTTLFIQALDLGVIVPLSFVSGVLLLRRNAWGYLLASVAVLKFLTLGLAVSAMGINMARIGVPVSPIELVVFPALALVNLIMVGLLLKHIEVPALTPRAA